MGFRPKPVCGNVVHCLWDP